MFVDILVEDRIATCLGHRTSRNEIVTDRSRNSIKEVLKLYRVHPLRVSLLKVRPTTKIPPYEIIRAWRSMRNDINGAKHNPVDRQLLRSHTLQSGEHDPGKPSFLEEPYVHGELRRAALLWSIYRFLVRYKPSPDNATKLEWLARWQTLTPED